MKLVIDFFTGLLCNIWDKLIISKPLLWKGTFKKVFAVLSVLVIYAHNSYLSVIGVHEMHDRMYPNYWQITILLVVDHCSSISLAYFMMTQPLPIAGKLSIKTLVAKQLPTNIIKWLAWVSPLCTQHAFFYLLVCSIGSMVVHLMYHDPLIYYSPTIDFTYICMHIIIIIHILSHFTRCRNL